MTLPPSFQKLANINLIKGGGDADPRGGLCIMELVDYFDGADRVTDQPACACPVLTAFAIRLNDAAPSQTERNTLKPLLPLLTDSRDGAAIKARVRLLVFETARRIVAPQFDGRWPQHAAAIRAAADYGALIAACKKAERAAFAALTDFAACAAALAIADAADFAAAFAADVAADVAARGGVMRADPGHWHAARDILAEAVLLGAHGGLDMQAPETEARAEQLLTLVGAQ